jgi:hypothetical protein
MDGGKVVSPTHQPHFTLQKHYFFVMFPVLIYVSLNKPRGPSGPEELGKFKISPHRVSNPQPSAL